MLPIKYRLQQFYRLSLILIIGIAFALPTFAQTGIPAGSMSQCDAQMQTFMNNYQVPGATLAITKNGRLVYMRAFGTANQAGTEATQPYHMFRIASISKPITSVAIMKLIENGQLSLSDKPFGPGGILNADPYFANANVTDTRVYNITIQNLLEHSAGWNRNLPPTPNPPPPYPWSYAASDPIDFPLHVTQTLGEPNPVKRRNLIKYLMQKGLDFTPGTAFGYSNVGFLVLGEVIEKKTGMTYENYVKQNIFAPLGIYDIRLGKNLLADKQERGGEYISPWMTLSAYGTGQPVPWQYGGSSVEAMDAHGGWIATPRDLVRLFTAFDGFPSRPDILSPATLQIMTTPSATLNSYAKGIQVNSTGFWWHAGALFGSYSWMVRNNNQVTWAVIMNKRSDAASFEGAVANIGFGNCVNATTTFPTHDLFDVPTQNAAAMNFSNVTSNSTSVNWTNGNGDGRVLIMRTGGAPNKFPLDGTDYASVADLGDGNRVVYSGAGNSATVGNLDGNTNYQFRLYEYKKNANTGNYALYQLANAAGGSQNTLGTTAQTTTRFDFDGDSKADVSVFRNGNWYIQGSGSGFSARNWGFATDLPAPADFDGDGRTDVAVFRNGNWYWINSSNGAIKSTQFGSPGDLPVPSDYTGDGKADAAVFRPSNGTWYWLDSATNQFNGVQFGAAGDKPIIGDFNGDGKSDLAVTRITDGNLNWYWMESSTNQFRAVQWGFATDIAAPADFDGDGKTDVSIFRPSNGSWYRLNSGQNNQFFAIQFGQTGDVPVPADYDGDGKADVAVFRLGNWYRFNSSNGAFFGQQFGITEDKPIPSAFRP